MQTKMFVFIGVPNSKSSLTINEIEDRLKFEFSPNNKSILFEKKDELLTWGYNEVNYYISILKSKNELNDWIQLAEDFELSSDLTSLTETSIAERYNKLRITHPNLYSETEYSIAATIFNVMKQFVNLDILSFQ